MSMMRAGYDTGSLMNHLMSRQTIGAPVPTVGMGATILRWSDRQAATVVAVEGKIVSVQWDKATRTDSLGMSDCQEYSYERDPEGCIEHFRMDGRGGYDSVYKNPETGRWNRGSRGGLIVGKRQHYHDYSF